jgi:hypothetical protein
MLCEEEEDDMGGDDDDVYTDYNNNNNNNKHQVESEDYLDCSSMSENDIEIDTIQRDENNNNNYNNNCCMLPDNQNLNQSQVPNPGTSLNFDLSVNCGGNSNNSNRTNRFFPDAVVDILNKWFYENLDYPYPDEAMTNFLAKEAHISPKQVRKWFANKRVRSNKCYKQTFRKKECRSRRETVINSGFFLFKWKVFCSLNISN